MWDCVCSSYPDKTKRTICSYVVSFREHQLQFVGMSELAKSRNSWEWLNEIDRWSI